MDIIWESFTYIFKDRDWAKKLFWGGIIGLIPFLNISLLGYMVEIMNSTYQGRNKSLPEFNILSQFITGLKISIIFSIYFFIIFMLFIIILATFLAIFNLNDDIIGILAIIFFAILMLLF